MTIRRTGAVLLTALLAGCGFLSRPKNTFYSLQTMPATAPPAAVATGAPVGIDSVELPPGLDRRDLFVRGAEHKVDVRGTNQWTAPLHEMVVHTLAFDLANRLPEGMVVLPGAAKPGSMRSIDVVFEELAPGPEPVFVLDARWTFRNTGAADTAHHERITVPMTSLDSAQIADAMSRALAMLADRIAAGV